MLSADIGQLRKDMVNLETARLARKRVKTADVDNVPTVDYLLRPETVALLKEYASDDAALMLTSSSGTPLWESRADGDKTTQKALIYQQRTRAEAPITFKAFRSISATTLDKHEEYGRYVEYFLGHSPKSIADRQYRSPSKELFDRAMTWLREQILG